MAPSLQCNGSPLNLPRFSLYIMHGFPAPCLGFVVQLLLPSEFNFRLHLSLQIRTYSATVCDKTDTIMLYTSQLCSILQITCIPQDL